MRIICQNGFYKFFPDDIAEINRFQNKYGFDLIECEDYFTFPVLAALPNFSFIDHPYSGLIQGLVNYSATRELVMAANGFTYSQADQGLVLVSAVSSLRKRLNYSVSNYINMESLPQAYYYDGSKLVTGFNGFCDVDYMKFRIERFFYEDI